MSRLKVLISAYACEPGKGSEPGVGWNLAREMAKHHDIWVLTRANNRTVIEKELVRKPVPGLRFVYFDLPRWMRWWKKGGRGVHLYYLLWQLGAFWVARSVHRAIEFDIVHHVTFVNYWMPSAVALLPIPFIWGPVGGGESAPKAFWSDFSARGKRYERLRNVARWLGERNPLVRLTARRSQIALATTEDTAQRLRCIGCHNVRVLPAVAIDLREVSVASDGESTPDQAVRFVSVGNLLHWKGFHLGLRAFAAARMVGTEYWVIGDGPERGRLEGLARDLGVADRVHFWGQLPREQVLSLVGSCTALVHPSLHDSGCSVCLEAMALGKPVLCLDLGGPAIQVTPETGYKVSPRDPEQAVSELARALAEIATDPGLHQWLGENGRERVAEHFTWLAKCDVINHFYLDAAARRAGHQRTSL